jgi:hypothetical protein
MALAIPRTEIKEELSNQTQFYVWVGCGVLERNKDQR